MILKTYFTDDRGKNTATQKLNRLYDFLYEEWVQFLSKLFPSDSLAIYQLEDVLSKKQKKNERNRQYRELINKKKAEPISKQSTRKVSKIVHNEMSCFLICISITSQKISPITDKNKKKLGNKSSSKVSYKYLRIKNFVLTLLQLINFKYLSFISHQLQNKLKMSQEYRVSLLQEYQVGYERSSKFRQHLMR